MSEEQDGLDQVVNTASRMGVNGVPVYRVRCPYCSNVNTFRWEDEITIFGKQEGKVLACHSDFKEQAGFSTTSYQGCGRSYAFSPKIEIEGTVRKIEAEEAAKGASK